MASLPHKAKRILKLGYRHIQYRVPSRIDFHIRRPVLSALQTRILGDLNRSGIAFVPFRDLFPEDTLWQRLVEEINHFVASEPVQQAIRLASAPDPESARQARKDYIVQQYEDLPEPPSLGPGDPWLQTGVDARLLDIANSYLGIWSKLQYMDRWYTVPIARQSRVNSQNWHRDPEDPLMLKVFLFFSDVNEAAGPFQYIPGSSQFKGRKYQYLWPTSPQNRNYPPSGELERLIPASDWVTCACPPGTLVFCNTTGFHRGGFATGRERISAVWMYASPLFGRCFRPVGISRLHGPARFALT